MSPAEATPATKAAGAADASVPEFENVLLSVADGVGTITLNRPDKLNAFASTMRQEVVQAVEVMTAHPDVRAVVITGACRAFCAWADIGYMKAFIPPHHPQPFRALVQPARRGVPATPTAPHPGSPSVNGAAAGGGANLALSCDIRIASDRASIGQTFNKIGLHPDWGGTYFLPRLVGPAKAFELISTGEMVPATEAHRIGLFNRVVPHELLAEETSSLARRLAAKPPLALALAKQALHQSDVADLNHMLDVELDHQLRCFESHDTVEGLNAFLEKREPTFRGD